MTDKLDWLKVLMTGTVILMIIAWLTAIYLEQYQHRNEKFCKQQSRTVETNYFDETKTKERKEYYNREMYDRCMESLSTNQQD